MADDYYAILGVAETATADEIKGRFRFLSQAYHPDKFGSESHRQKAEEEFKRLNGAYQILSDPEKRARYDASRRRTAPAPPKPGPKTTDSQATQPVTIYAERTTVVYVTTCGLAKRSLGLAITSLFCLTVGIVFSIPAVIYGHRAIAQIDNSSGRLRGRGLAKAGIYIGYANMIFAAVVILAALFGNFSK